MVPKQLRTLRIVTMVMIALLILQYELGMTVNLSDPQNIPPFTFSVTAVSEALRGIGPVALLHAGMGGLLFLLAAVGLVLSLVSKVRSVQILGVLGFLSMMGAVSTGLLFILSGFQNDGYSHGMATQFILTFTFYFLELYFSKPDVRPAKQK